MDPTTASTIPDEPALIANRYRLLARIHAGSTGSLHRAEDLAGSRTVALRILTPALSRDAAVLARMQARLHAGSVMAGADLVDLTDLGRTDAGLVFVVTDFIAGDSLATQLAREGPIAWRTLRPLLVRACQIIHLSHQHGLLRLDLQTRHFFPVRDKSRTSTLKVLSTGIGDVFGESLWASLSPTAAAAHLRYAAPEQVTGGSVDARTDVYALGVIMYELLTGRVPFADPRPAYVCARHLLEPAPPLTGDRGGPIPEAVAAIVARALAKAPEDRWPTMRALANAMAAIEFGPCDASGVLEVEDVAPPMPAASSASMRIDPAARQAPSPAVRPPTLPPLRDAFMAEAPSSEARAERHSAAPRSTVPEHGAPALADPPPRRSPVLSARPDPRDPGSSSTMAWEEILAAADEAVAAVASVATSGTAGDSGVFIPERLLHSGEAATASMTRGRRSTASSRSATAIQPRTLVLRADADVAAASTTLQLDDADLRDIDDPAGDSAADLPTLTTRRARAALASAPATTPAATPTTPARALGPANLASPTRTTAPEAGMARAPATGTGLAAGSTLNQVAPSGHASSTEVAASSHGSTDSAGSLRAAIDRSATVWPAASRSQVARSPARPIAWAAALVVTLAGTAGGVRLLRPREPTTTPIVAVSPPPVAGRRTRSADLAPRTGRAASATPVIDLSQETSDPGARDQEPTQWPIRTGVRRPEPTVATAPISLAGPAGASAVSPPDVASVARPAGASAVAPPDVAPVPAVPPPPAAPPTPAPLRPPAALARNPPAGSPQPAETSAEPPPGPRKSAPGARLPDAGHELAAPLDHDPMRAAALLTRAEQTAARGEQGLALSLAIQSYHAGPSTNALHLAGTLACKLGDAGKVRWALTHLPPADRSPVEAACTAAGVALE